MPKLRIDGGYPLSGTIRVGGAKNAVLKLMAASLLGNGTFVIKDAPSITDVFTMAEMLRALGAHIAFTDHELKISIGTLSGEAPENLVREMRASIQVMGPLLAKLGWVKISMPGGCALGERPIDFHLKNFRKLGVVIEEKDGYILATSQRLVGTDLTLDFPSVGATENLMMAACLAQGTTRIYNAAREPEIVDIQNFLNLMGAKVSGAGSRVIEIHGVPELGSTDYRVIPDRIEAGTYIVAGALQGQELVVENVIPAHLESLLTQLHANQIDVEVSENRITVSAPKTVTPADMTAAPYPGFPTDLQPQYLALVTKAQGTSVITETVYKDRFRYVQELQKMGADVVVDHNMAIVRGVSQLHGAPVKATDLRAGAALVLAALAADGQSEISGLEHVDRGYEKLVDKLKSVGARIRREP